ncbi:MAG: SH3 domain-containing protein, partial [Anaerolineae bacterium]|nr:SH3 domain-containing protein [Anaerolineae bacterium]
MLRYVVLALVLLAVFPVTAQADCTLPTRLQASEAGRVLYTDGDPLNVRAQPSTSGAIVGRLPEGADFVVEAGPTCAGGIQWWQVQGDGARGWIAEGLDGAYFVEFLTNVGWD